MTLSSNVIGSFIPCQYSILSIFLYFQILFIIICHEIFFLYLFILCSISFVSFNWNISSSISVIHMFGLFITSHVFRIFYAWFIIDLNFSLRDLSFLLPWFQTVSSMLCILFVRLTCEINLWISHFQFYFYGVLQWVSSSSSSFFFLLLTMDSGEKMVPVKFLVKHISPSPWMTQKNGDELD